MSMLKRIQAVARHYTIKRSTAALRDALNPERLLGLTYVWFQKRLAVEPRTILVESQKGESLTGSPYYMVRHMASSARYRGFKIVVVARDRRLAASIRTAFGASIRICGPRSIWYCRHLAAAGILINDTTFPPYFSRRESQKYLNTWHGTPLKAMGRKEAHGMLNFISNPQRNFLHITHLLAPNSHTEQVFLRDYMLEDVAQFDILRCGYPRNDALLNNPKMLSSRDGRHHIAYMPTWRGTLSTSHEESAILLDEIEKLLRYLDLNLPDHHHIWAKLHPLVRGKLDFSCYKRIQPFPDDVEAYDFLARCDCLVTDYSSVMFDFAVTSRAVYLYTPDLLRYEEDRGFCMDPLALPFPRAKTEAELASFLESALIEPSESRQAFIQAYCQHDDGSSTERLCRHFVLDEPIIETSQPQRNHNRKNVLLFVGSFLNNGITSSIKNLVSCIDLERYNLILCVDAAAGGARDAQYFGSLNPRIGFIPTRNLLAVDFVDGFRYLCRELFWRRFSSSDNFLRTIWTREFRRLFGTASFDVVVHFTGYDRRICMLLLGTQAKKVVFMHNDMHDEIRTDRVADPRALRLAYTLADTIAMVRENLDCKFSREFDDVSAKVALVPNTLSTSCIQKSHAPLVLALHEDMREELAPRLEEAMQEQGAFRFVNLGRFSAEKGHDRLIRAFEKVWIRHPQAQLFILGPHGVLFEETRRQARLSRASSAIFVSLGSTNPFPLLAKADSFVFSSHYEGIGLVLYESFALGIPVLAPAIPGPAELLSQGYGLVVENSVQGLEDGMLQAIGGHVPRHPYDFSTHNQDALQRLYEVLG